VRAHRIISRAGTRGHERGALGPSFRKHELRQPGARAGFILPAIAASCGCASATRRPQLPHLN